MKRIHLFALSMVLLSLPTPLRADIIPGRWEKVEALGPDTSVIVKLKSGERIECSIEGVRPDALYLTDRSQREIRILKNEVREIITADAENDPVKDGVLWGLLIGGIGGTAVGAATMGQLMQNEGGSASGVAAASGMIGAGIGALIGYVGDTVRKSRIVLYRAPEE